MNRATVRKLYRDAIVQVFGYGDKEHDEYLAAAAKRDVHLGNKAPGGWAPKSVLEIYCEGGIPNDGFGYPHVEGRDWYTVDGVVNLMLEAMGKRERYYHEPYNAAVINVWEA